MSRHFVAAGFAVLLLLSTSAELLAQFGAAAAPQPVKEEPPPRKRPDTEIGRRLAALEEAGKTLAFDDEWALRLKAVIDFGPKGVPELIEELDATQNNMMLRCLGFSLRAIGDKRAVPALIRAFPKTLLPPGSDMGCRAKDKDLMEFMRKHDLDPDDRADHYGFGRPVREIGGALTALTGVKQNEEELYSIFLDGGPTSQRQQRHLFEQCAKRWADWWNVHGKELIGERDFAPIEIKAAEPPAADSFPFGESVKFGSGHSGYVLQPDTHADAGRVFYDLDTGRMASLPPSLLELPAGRERDDEIQAWAAREGFDLMGVEQKANDAERPHYFLRAGLSAWPVLADRWETLEADLKEPNPPPLGRPIGGLLSARDATSGALKPDETAAFLFRTREGTCGALFVGVEVHDTNVVLGKRLEGDINLDPVAFNLGRRFGYKRIEEGK